MGSFKKDEEEVTRLTHSISYHISGGLSLEQLDQIHAAALQILEEVGVEVSFPEILRAVAGQAGVQIQGQRVTLDPALVDAFVSEYREARDQEPVFEDPYGIDILSGYAFQIVDLDTQALRPMTTEDCTQMAKLVDGLHEQGVSGGTPGMPQDVPAHHREVLSYKIGCEYSRTSGDVGITSLAGAETMYRMAQVVHKPFGLPIFTLDPLRVAGDSIAIALDFIRRGRRIGLGFSSMPLLGLTAPIDLPGAFVSNIAMVWGTYALFRMMDLQNDLRVHFDVYPFDMRTGSVAYGTPEHVLIHLLGTQINRYYGAHFRVGKPFHTNAMFPDAHAQIQRACFASAAILNGARRFTFGGMLGLDKVFSGEQLLIDVEILNHVRILAEGFRFSPDRLDLTPIKDTGPGGTFITHPSTLERYREIYASPLFKNSSPESQDLLRPDFLSQEIRERARSIIARHDFELPQDERKELDRLYQAFKDGRIVPLLDGKGQ